LIQSVTSGSRVGLGQDICNDDHDDVTCCIFCEIASLFIE